jgi:hypothetical protein
MSTTGRVGWIVAAVLLIAAAAAGVYAANLRLQLQDVELRLVDAVNKLEESEQRLVGAATQLSSMRTNLALLSAPDTIELTLVGKATPGASGRVFLSKAHGLLIAVTGLTPLAEERSYQIWMLGKSAPVNAGMLQPDAQGNATAAFDLPSDATLPPSGLQLTDEPPEGATRPTGAIALATP